MVKAPFSKKKKKKSTTTFLTQGTLYSGEATKEIDIHSLPCVHV